MNDTPNRNYVSSVYTPDGQTTYLKDAEARAAVTAAESRILANEQGLANLAALIAAGTRFIGKTTTQLTDRCTTTPVTVAAGTGGVTVVPKSGDFTVLEKTVGDATLGIEYLYDGTYWNELGSAGTMKALAYKDTASGKVTPTGTVSKPTATVRPTVERFNAVSVTVHRETETLAFGSAQKCFLTGIAIDVSQPTFTGDEKTVTVS